jgi:signal transduction histidine kinase
MFFLRKALAAIALLSLSAGQPLAGPALADLSLTRLEQRKTELDAELDQLAHYSLRSGIGSIGFRSMQYDRSQQTEWVKIDLGGEFPIDEIVLVPVIRRDSQERFQADGFPEAFRITAGTATDQTGTLVAESGSGEPILPRIAPIVIPTAGITASWVRIEATRLSRDAQKDQYVLQLAEVLIFSQEEDVALRRPVTTSSIYPLNVAAWDKRFLVDGQMPYVMDAAQGMKSAGYISPRTIQPTLIVDLGEPFPLSRIQLHALDLVNTVPQANAGDLGIPPRLKIEGSTRPDFSDAIPLLDFQKGSILDTGPILIWNLPATACRYVRLTGEKSGHRTTPIGFAEIELFSGDRNVALGKPVGTAQKNLSETEQQDLASLTDGRNLYGDILPLRTWLNELARRHDLEIERPQVLDELNRRYARQKATLNRMSWLAALLAAGIGFTILIDWNLRIRHAARIKKRFAADLHDELGANLHTIGLLGDLARDAASRDELLELLDRSRVFTERSGAAVRYCTNMLEARSLCEDLVEEMKRSAGRLLADLDHDLSFEGESHLETLKPRKRIDLFFFYKECLNNIIRHSGATRVRTRLIAGKKEIQLTVCDNGAGLTDEAPPSLKRRARLLGAKLSVETPAAGGTEITLRLRNRGKR